MNRRLSTMVGRRRARVAGIRTSPTLAMRTTCMSMFCIVIPTALVAQDLVRQDSAGVEIVVNHVAADGMAPAFEVAKAPAAVFRLSTDVSDIRGAFQFAGGGVLVADGASERVIYFDSAGKRQFVVGNGRSADGAGSFDAIMGVVAAGPGAAAVWDAARNRLTVLNARGTVLDREYLGAPPMGATPIGPMRSRYLIVGQLTADRYVAAVEVPYRDKTTTRVGFDSVAIVLLTKQGHRIRTDQHLRFGEYFEFRDSGNVAAISGPVPLAHLGHVAVSQKSWYLTRGTTWEIEKWSANGRLVSLFRITRPIERLRTDLWRQVSADLLDSVAPPRRSLYERALAWIPREQTVPAYVGLLGDTHGRIWAELWTRPNRPSEWDVFQSDGTYLGSVEMPPSCQVVQVGDSAMLCVREGGNDTAEQVRSYAVHHVRN